MRLISGPDNTPELMPYSSDDRREIWQRFYRRSVLSVIGALALVAYVALVSCALVLAEHFAISRLIGIVVGNLVGAFVCQEILARSVQRRIRERLSKHGGF